MKALEAGIFAIRSASAAPRRAAPRAAWKPQWRRAHASIHLLGPPRPVWPLHLRQNHWLRVHHCAGCDGRGGEGEGRRRAGIITLRMLPVCVCVGLGLRYD